MRKFIYFIIIALRSFAAFAFWAVAASGHAYLRRSISMLLGLLPGFQVGLGRCCFRVEEANNEWQIVRDGFVVWPVRGRC